MTEGKFLSDVIDTSSLPTGAMNVIVAPCGCGKTTAAINRIAKIASAPRKALYLIDTANGCRRLAMDENLQLPCEFYEDIIENNLRSFTEREDRVVVTTYAKFGMFVKRYPDFASNFEVIICDEAHNLFYFSTYEDGPTNALAARCSLAAAASGGRTKVVAMTATPQGLKYLYCPKRFIDIDVDSLRHYEEKKVVRYTNVKDIIRQLPPSQRGMMYVTLVRQMKELEVYARECGRNPICVWSEGNKDHAMTQEQLAARNYILEHEELPPQYDLFIYNASSETGINIRGDLGFVIVHNANETHITQARGRYRGDLHTLYVYDRENGTVFVPDEFLNRQLFEEDKKELQQRAGVKTKKGDLISVSKLEALICASGYLITKGRYQNRHYIVISKA